VFVASVGTTVRRLVLGDRYELRAHHHRRSLPLGVVQPSLEDHEILAVDEIHQPVLVVDPS